MNVWNIIEAISIFAMFACIVVLAVINERLRRALEWELEKNTRRIRVEQILKEEAKKPPCILRPECPGGCEFYKPKEVSDERYVHQRMQSSRRCFLLRRVREVVGRPQR